MICPHNDAKLNYIINELSKVFQTKLDNVSIEKTYLKVISELICRSSGIENVVMNKTTLKTLKDMNCLSEENDQYLFFGCKIIFTENKEIDNQVLIISKNKLFNIEEDVLEIPNFYVMELV